MKILHDAIVNESGIHSLVQSSSKFTITQDYNHELRCYSLAEAIVVLYFLHDDQVV